MKRIVPIAAALSIGLLMPQTANAASIWAGSACAGSTLQSCVDFDLSQTGNTYFFSVTYASSLALDPGVITAVGLYDLNGAPHFTFSNVAVVSSPGGKTWTAAGGEHCHLTGDGVGKQLFEACADADPPPTANGLLVGETVVFSFTSSKQIELEHFSAPGGLGARAHVQSFGTPDCSFKVDSRTGQVSGPEQFNNDIDQCGTPVTVPEPMSMLLLGSGLLGVGVVARRRRNVFEVEA